jgi:hypothetical protein
MGWRDRLHRKDVNALGDVLKRIYNEAEYKRGREYMTTFPGTRDEFTPWGEVVKAVLDIAQATVDDVPPPVELPPVEDREALTLLDVDPESVIDLNLTLGGQRYGWRYYVDTRHMHPDMAPLAREHAVRRGVEAIVNRINGKDVTP